MASRADRCDLSSIDVALPTECDDEYWLTPEGKPLFKQPPDTPSKVTVFVCLIRLGRILALAMRTIVSVISTNFFDAKLTLQQYSSNKSKVQLARSDQQWEERIVAELDSGLNKWATSLPSHCKPPPYLASDSDMTFMH